MADEVTDAIVAEEMDAWREYRGRKGHPAADRWRAAMTAVQCDPDALDAWLERMVTGAR